MEYELLKGPQPYPWRYLLREGDYFRVPSDVCADHQKMRTMAYLAGKRCGVKFGVSQRDGYLVVSRK